jgi:hypothetical protein
MFPTLPRGVLECVDFAGPLPKLHVVTVNEVLGVFVRGVIIGAKKFDSPHELAVHTNDIRPAFGHRIRAGAQKRASVCRLHAEL